MSQGHAKILAEAASLNPSALLELLILDASAIGGGILRFHDGTDTQSRPVVFRGESYTPLPVKTEGFTMSGSGELPRPTVTFSNLMGVFTGLSRAYGDLVSSRVIRRLVFARNLDGMPEADSREMFQEDIYFVERKLRENRMEVTYELVPATDIDGAKIPRRQVIAAACVWRYRSPIGCAFASNVAIGDKDNEPHPTSQTYRGEWNASEQYYTRDVVFIWQDFEKTTKSLYILLGDSATGEAQGPLLNSEWKLDQCSHRLSGCKLRFDQDSVNTQVVKPILIASGQRARHSLAVRSSHLLKVWGGNTYGQTTLPSGIAEVSQIACGDYHSVALKVGYPYNGRGWDFTNSVFKTPTSGVVAAWGYNGYGQTTVPANLIAKAIATGAGHVLAVKEDGTVVAWGWDYAGQVSAIPSGLTGVVDVAAGYLHSYALKSDKTLVGWGQNAYLQLTPPSGLSGVIAIACGEYHNLALKDDGTVVAWGVRDFPSAIVVPSGLANVRAIACGLSHSLAVQADGTVVAWGDNTEGQCTVPPSASPAIAVAGGLAHSMALKEDGTIVCWGRNVEGQSTLPANMVETTSITSTATLPFGGFPGSSRIPR